MIKKANENEIKYRLIRSNRKTISISVNSEGMVMVKAPIGLSRVYIEQFIEDKRDWINKTVEKQRTRFEIDEKTEKLTYEELKKYADITMQRITPFLEEYSKKLGVSYNRVTVKNQRTRWGSCSSKRNLNFNCLLAAAPDSVVRYVVVHELCHLVEMNHSKRFWLLVESLLPDYRKEVKWIKGNGHFLIARLP